MNLDGRPLASKAFPRNLMPSISESKNGAIEDYRAVSSASQGCTCEAEIAHPQLPRGNSLLMSRHVLGAHHPGLSTSVKAFMRRFRRCYHYHGRHQEAIVKPAAKDLVPGKLPHHLLCQMGTHYHQAYQPVATSLVYR